MIVRKLTSALIGAGMLIPGIAGALGLGGIELNSGLNQPLDADIRLSRVGDLIEDEIRIKLAGYDDFEKAGVERVFFLTGFKFDVQIMPDGSGVIHLTSKKPVKEPFLNFIIEMQWPQGRLLREYTVLLDPPVFNQQAQLLLIHPPTTTNEVPVQQEIVQASEVAEIEDDIAEEVFAKVPADDIDISSDLDDEKLDYEDIAGEEIADEDELLSSVDEGEKKTDSFELSEEDESSLEDSDYLEEEESTLSEDAESTLSEESTSEESTFSDESESLEETESIIASPSPLPSVSMVSPEPLPGTYGKIVRNENLWQISNKVKPAGLTAQQTMMAIKKLNSQAFIHDNINYLREGHILRLPTFEEISEIDAQVAVRMVAEQNRQWVAAKNAEKTDSLDSMPLEDGAYAEFQPEVDKNESDARLKLLAANTYSATESGSLGARDGDEGGANVARIQDKLLQTEENLDRSELENQELTSRLNEVEAQVETSNEIIELKDSQIAALQAKLRELEEQADVPESELSVIEEPDLNTDQDLENEVEVSSTKSFEEELLQEERLQEEEVQSTDNIQAPEQVDSSLVNPTPVIEPVSEDIINESSQQAKDTELGMVEKVIENAKLIASNPMYLLAGGGALVLLLVGGFILMRKSSEDEDEYDDEDYDEGIDFAMSNESDSESESESDELNDDDDSYLKSGESDSSETSSPEEEEATMKEFHGTAEEAIGEADIYIAYGRHAHAIAILSQVLEKEPGRLDLMKKLLEVYGEMGDEIAYAKLEAEINSAESGSGATSTPPMSFDADPEPEPSTSFSRDSMEKTTLVDESDDSMNFDIEDESELDDMQANLEAVESDLDASLDMDTTDESTLESVSQENEESDFFLEETDSLTLEDDTPEEEIEAELDNMILEDDSGDELETLEFSLDEVESVAELDVDLDLDEGLDEGPEEESESEGLEFSLDVAENDDEHEIDLEFEESSETETFEVDISEEVQELEEPLDSFELAEDVSDEATDPNTKIKVEMSTEGGLSDADDDDDFDFLNDVDEAATKLDLARAYIDMGDKDGARDILEEVITDGDENQKKDANELLQRIA